MRFAYNQLRREYNVLTLLFYLGRTQFLYSSRTELDNQRLNIECNYFSNELIYPRKYWLKFILNL